MPVIGTKHCSVLAVDSAMGNADHHLPQSDVDQPVRAPQPTDRLVRTLCAAFGPATPLPVDMMLALQALDRPAARRH